MSFWDCIVYKWLGLCDFIAPVLSCKYWYLSTQPKPTWTSYIFRSCLVTMSGTGSSAVMSPGILVQFGSPSICPWPGSGLQDKSCGCINRKESGMRVLSVSTADGRVIWVYTCLYADIMLLPKGQQVQHFQEWPCCWTWHPVLFGAFGEQRVIFGHF